MEQLTLKLRIVEINTILSALGRLPFQEVAELIHNVREQGAEQLKDMTLAESMESPVQEGETTEGSDES